VTIPKNRLVLECGRGVSSVLLTEDLSITTIPFTATRERDTRFHFKFQLQNATVKNIIDCKTRPVTRVFWQWFRQSGPSCQGRRVFTSCSRSPRVHQWPHNRSLTHTLHFRSPRSVHRCTSVTHRNVWVFCIILLGGVPGVDTGVVPTFGTTFPLLVSNSCVKTLYFLPYFTTNHYYAHSQWSITITIRSSVDTSFCRRLSRTSNLNLPFFAVYLVRFHIVFHHPCSCLPGDFWGVIFATSEPLIVVNFSRRTQLTAGLVSYPFRPYWVVYRLCPLCSWSQMESSVEVKDQIQSLVWYNMYSCH
jgi:hypothetical protein